MKSSLQERGPGNGVMSCEFGHFNPAIVLYICGLQLQVFIKKRSHGHALVFFDGSHFFPLFLKTVICHRTERKEEEEKVLSLQRAPHISFDLLGERTASCLSEIQYMRPGL